MSSGGKLKEKKKKAVVYGVTLCARDSAFITLRDSQHPYSPLFNDPIVLMFTASGHGQLSIGERFLCAWHCVTCWLGVLGGADVAPRLGRWLWAHGLDSGPTWTLLSRLHVCATVLSSASCSYYRYLGCGVL